MNKYDDTDYQIEREESIEYEEDSDINVGSIEKDIKRCEELIKPEHANWIGISNQLAIAHIVERIKRLEYENETLKDFTSAIFNENIEKEFIRVQKVKDLIKDETINISGFECIAVEDIEKLVEDK